MSVNFHNDWNDLLIDEFKKDYYIKLRNALKREYNSQTVYPDMHDIFNALHFTSYEDVKVVIIGQDPYHGYNQAHGLSFSVKPEVAIPPSLMNIFKELQDDLGCTIPKCGYLKKWADQGVLLLNSILTVRAGTPASHRNLGWENFTDNVIRLVNQKSKPVVFILWGKFAQSKEPLITNKRHLIIKSPHPSPFSATRGFFGSKPFSRTNNFLIAKGMAPIDWQL